MRSKLISALAATALIAAVPSIAVAQDDDDGIGTTEAALGVIFVLVAGVILFWDDEGDPISP
ncbi:MAG TPA: hypothetical protein VEA60_09525 [Allosphingosinicella sp.]|nr:hypothetical protein [Allosphingosinicella sp.]